MQTYNGKINEFVDWVTGIDSTTGQNVTDGMQVSGGSIRELLQNRLKEPFVMKEDVANNKYRLFSSEEAYATWLENPTDNQDLELFNFARPSDYKLDLTAIDSDGFNNKFIRYGDSTSTGSRIAFHWSIYNDEGESSDSLSVKYTISNTSTGSSTSFTRWYNKSDVDPNFSIYEYLQPGENVVSIEAKGSSTGARNNRTFTIVLLQVNLTSTFRFYEKFSPDSPIQIPYTFERNNVTGTAKIYFRIDDGAAGKTVTRDVVQDGPTRITETQRINVQLSEGTHSLQMWAETKYNDGNITVNSNLLYFTFTVASSVVGSTGKFINISQSFENGNFPLSDLMLHATQYEPAYLDWGYYTDSLQTNTSIPVTWKLLYGLDDPNPTILGNITANSREKASRLSYIPSIYTDSEHDTYIAAYFNDTLLRTIPIYIVKNNKIKVTETGFYELKMSAYGRTNDSSDKSVWNDETGNVTAQFTGVAWNTNSGWYNNSFRTVGVNEHATISAEPFSNFNFVNGKTVEIEFESEKVSNNDDKLVIIGNPSGARIEITPDTATLYGNSNTEVVHTNYKANERIKLAFIINAVQEDAQDRTVESGLAYIINNGILERSAIASGQSFNTAGNIKIGGSTSGVRVYNLRVYDYSISYMDAYNNFVYDNPDKATISTRNDILNSAGEIDFDLCKNKIDTILISGNLSNILSGQSDKDSSKTDVTIERFCPSDSSKNFKIVGAQIRKHGQSTLNYPITSMKFWLNKSKSGAVPVFELTQQENLLLNKNRYVMKQYDDQGKPSIPSNKFVLQANYADSSGVHNGSLQRLMQTSWFGARINGEYKLRTAPQLFATDQIVHHNNENLGEIGSNSWVEGYGSRNGQNIQWGDVSNSEFPYDIRISPDSFPCAVFYYDEQGEQKRTFLGQYVFMDDKKSDYLYGERSIYAVPKDPFCLTNTYKSMDTKENRVWSNKDVLRIEVLGSNVPFTSYMTHDNFTNVVSVTDQTTGKVTEMYNWEQAFELVYPDEDDVIEVDATDAQGNPILDGSGKKVKVKENKFLSTSNFAATVQPFVDFHEWVVSTYQNQAKFEAEASQHLDLYKMAAYYIFVLRFGLVDSLERNAQLKTYDGQHWHYEPWDMDIALGNKNDGGIAYDPPIDRNTKLPGSVTTYAISGRSADNNGNIATSNWLFDALEAWGYWSNTIVPEVAQALYEAGLTYNNISRMFDEDYAAKWCELMYNESGFFKYIQSGNGDSTWLSWLQGSRMTHRHWWLSNSMDYYDAKWFCGDYKSHFLYIRANVTEGSQAAIRITPNKQTYMSVTKDDVLQITQAVSQLNPLNYVLSAGSNTKNPIRIYGANFMEEVDLSDIALGLDGVTLTGVYSEVLGSPLKRLNVGVPVIGDGDTKTATVGVASCQIQGNADTFENLQSLNIRGQRQQTDLNGLVYNNDISELSEVLAMGSGLINFYSSQSGNTFSKIEIPDTVHTFWVNNSSWSNLEFWHAEIGDANATTLTKLSGIPATVHDVSMLGTTGQTPESIQFIRSWIANIEAAGEQFNDYTITMDKIDWRDSTVGNENLLTYDELQKLSQFNGAASLKGYIVLKDTGVELTSQQLNNIKSWFGDTVFTKNSSGLVIDHKKNYVQINIGGDVIVDDQGNVSLEEGKTASLNATRFSLAEDDTTQYTWAIGPVGSIESYGRYNGLTVIQQDASIDGIAYITSTQSRIGQDYDVQITCSVEGINYSTTLHVIAATYPTTMTIATVNQELIAPRTVADYIELYQSGQAVNMYVTSNETYTGKINKVTYTITRNIDGVSVQYIVGGSTSDLDNLHDDYISVTANNDKTGLRISSDSAMPADESSYFYTITAVVRFTSGLERTVTSTLVISDDGTPIVSSNQVMFNAVNDAFTTQTGSSIGRNYFYKVDLMVLTGTIDFTSYAATLPNLVTSNGSYLFKYLPNVTGIILDGCNITNTANNIQGDDKRQFLFDNMVNLRTLSIQNCTGLTGDVDLTMCPEITQVDASGTTVNVLVPTGTKVTNYEVGAPATVSIVNPTQLTPAGVKVDSYHNIDSLDLVNIPDNKSFTMFAKVMEKYVIGGTVTFYMKRVGGNYQYDPSKPYYFISSKIILTPGNRITINPGIGNAAIVFYDENDNYIENRSTDTGTPRTVTVEPNTAYGIFAYAQEDKAATIVSVTDNTTNTVLFEYRS